MPFIMCRNRNFRQHQRVGRCGDNGDLSGTIQRVEASQMNVPNCLSPLTLEKIPPPCDPHEASLLKVLLPF
jgi:hypothetical protein